MAFDLWLLSLTGQPTLLDYWQGEVTTASGKKSQVALNIRYAYPSCANRPDPKGKAKVCGERDRIWDYGIWSDPDNWRGTQFAIRTREVEEQRDGLRLDYLEVSWDMDILHVKTQLISDRYPGYSIQTARDTPGKETTTNIGGDPDTYRPVEFTLLRGSEEDFSSACDRLWERS